MSGEVSNEWVEVKDPQSGKVFFANPKTGDCSWEKPEGATIKERNPAGEWWELFDEKNQLPYYYNITDSKTIWTVPTSGTVIKLSSVQSLDIMKRVSMMLGSDSPTTPVFPLPEGNVPPLDKDVVAEVKEASGTFDIQHAKLLPGWKQMFDSETGKNYYLNEATGEKSWDRAVATGTQNNPQVKLESLSDEKKADTLHKAKKLGISGPILNKEAAASMSSLNPINYSGDEMRKIPTTLASEITAFKFEDFTKKHFVAHKKGILRRRIPLEDQMCWTKETIPAPLMSMSKNAAKEAVNCFKMLQRTMRDKGTLKGSTATAYQDLLEIAINHGELRDEIYVQLCKQLTKNPSPESEMLGWGLMCVYVISFPPSKNFENYLASFLKNVQSEDPKIQTMARYCAVKLDRICKSGAKGKVLTIAEVERAIEAPFSPSIFGETLADVMKMQKEDEGDIPKVLPFLTEGIIKMGGKKSEGIFRVPGDAEMVTELRLRLEKGNYSLEGITDPMVPASLLKLWLRELTDPLIPMDLYPEAIQNSEEPKVSVGLVQKLDPLPRRVVSYIIQFLQVIADPANHPFTKMTVNNLAMVFAPNFLRCPSDNPQTIFENAKLEQNFVRNLILHLNTKGDFSETEILKA